jgi:hypothetical protein
MWRTSLATLFTGSAIHLAKGKSEKNKVRERP